MTCHKWEYTEPFNKLILIISTYLVRDDQHKERSVACFVFPKSTKVCSGERTDNWLTLFLWMLPEMNCSKTHNRWSRPLRRLRPFNYNKHKQAEWNRATSKQFASSICIQLCKVYDNNLLGGIITRMSLHKITENYLIRFKITLQRKQRLANNFLIKSFFERCKNAWLPK